MLRLSWEFSWLHSCPAHWWELYWRYTQQDSSEVPSPCLESCLHAEALSLGLHLSCIVALPMPAHLPWWSRSWPRPTPWTLDPDCRLVCHCVLVWRPPGFGLPCSVPPDLVFTLTCWHDFLVWSWTCLIAVHLSIATAIWTWQSELLAEPGVPCSLREQPAPAAPWQTGTADLP